MDVKDALEAAMEKLRARRDASLDLNPEEMADLMHVADEPVEGAATLQLSTDMIAQAMAAEALAAPRRPAAAAAAVGGGVAAAPVPAAAPAPAVAARPSRPAPPPAMMTGPSSAFNDTGGHSNSSAGGSNMTMVVGLGLVLAVAIGFGAWYFLTGGG